MLRRFVPAFAALFAVAGCAYPLTPRALPPANLPAPAAASAAAYASTMETEKAPVTILISIDGFPPEYLKRGITPNLSRLATEGVTGPMRPSFPSKTFPNHWTLVTGVRPDRHGIAANMMEDPTRPGETFTMASEDPFWWNASPPIWVTAEKAGIPTAAMYWPGSSVAWGGTRAPEWPFTISGGTRPTDWQQFSQQMPDANRARTVIDWMRRPAAIRPRFVATYFDIVDTAGHRFGPASAEVNAAIADVDRTIGSLVQDLAALNQPANLIIVSDHGMVGISSDRVIALDQIVSPTDARIVESGPYASFVPLPGREAAVEKALLRSHPHMKCWRKGELPAHLHYGRNPRVPPYLCLAEDGWMALPKAPTTSFQGGAHGYDPALPSMKSLFIANGPAFVPGREIEAFDNVAVAPLLRTLLGLPSDPALDGTDEPFRQVLKR